MTITVHDGGAITDVPSGEGYVVPLIPGQPAPDVSHAADAGVLLLPLIEGNLTTGDPVGDAYTGADLADKLGMNRTPTPPLVLRLDPTHARDNARTAQIYGALWADAAASRGYRPIIASTPDVIFSAAQGGANFDGAYPESFNLHGTPVTPEGTPPPEDPRSIPGLPGDVYTALRAYRYAEGLSVADSGFLGRVMPAPALPAPTDPTGPAPLPYQPPPAPAPTVAEFEDLKATVEAAAAVANGHAGELDDARARLGAAETAIATIQAWIGTDTAADLPITAPAGETTTPPAGAPTDPAPVDAGSHAAG